MLRQPSLNVFQRFAAGYFLRWERQRQVQDIEDQLQKQTWYLTPQRYQDLFLTDEAYPADALTMAGRPVEEVVDDLDEVDAYFDSLDERREITGAEIFNVLGDDSGWV